MSDTTNSTKYSKPFVRKLNRHFILRTISVMIRINLLMAVIICSWLLLKCETLMHDTTLPYVEIEYGQPANGFVMPNFIQKHLPINKPNASRTFFVQPHEENPTLPSWQRLVYKVSFSENDDNITMLYYLRQDITTLYYLAWIVLILELIMLIGVSRVRRIKHILKPINDMAKTTAQITPHPDMPVVGQLAGQISSIDAYELKRRISIDDAPNELKPLAKEINSLLDRISEAYASQVRFVSDASHELRTPISVIQGYADLLDRWGKTDKKTLDESIAAIKSEAYSMKNLIEQLLFLARGENDTLQLEIVDVDVCELVSETTHEMQIIAPDYSFETKLTEPVVIKADRNLLKQALRILLENSMKYSSCEEPITASVVLDEKDVKISVQDNGIGISADSLPHVFERFYRSEQSRARKTGGTGLGLAIAKLILDRHSFTLSILSRQGIGTRATITAKMPEIMK